MTDSKMTVLPPEHSGRGGLGGRPRGSTNHYTRQIKDMVYEALEAAGGADYLMLQAFANPVAFMGLVGKTLPMTIGGDPQGSPIMVQKITVEVIDVAVDAPKRR